MHKVFISYASDTLAIARELAESLEKNGVEVWGDWNLRPGDRWSDSINSALDWAGTFLVLVSPHSPVTQWQDTEWQAVLSKAWKSPRKKLIPVIVGAGEPPVFLRQWVHLRINPAATPQVWEKAVLNAILSPARKPSAATTQKNRRARMARLEEIGRAAEEMRSTQLA